MARQRPPQGSGPPEVDLHGLAPEAAFQKLRRELHACRVRRVGELLVITGRGMGNRTQQPVLRGRVEAFLRSGEGQRAGVRSFAVTARGGALLVELSVAGRAREPGEREEWDHEEWDED